MASRRAPASRLIVAELPVAYRVQSPLVVDASVIGALLFGEPERDQAETWMHRHLFAPALLDYEIANVAVKKLRDGLDPASVEMALRSYDTVDIELLQADALALVALVTRYQLSAYDAAYLSLAAELKGAASNVRSSTR